MRVKAVLHRVGESRAGRVREIAVGSRRLCGRQ
jgi:hypothetical protein